MVDNSCETPHLVQYCDREACFTGNDEWAQISERLESRDACDVADCQPTLPVEWERIAKNFEAQRREAVAARPGEWG